MEEKEENFIDNEVIEAENIFNNVLNGNNRLDFYAGVPTLEEFKQMPEYQRLNDDRFDENDLNMKMQLLADGKFTCKQVPDNFSDETESTEETSIFNEINENKFPLIYNSPFEDICTTKELHVDITKGMKGSFQTINEAIEEAMAGDTIVLEDGKYNESIIITKPVEIRSSTNDPSHCIINANEQDGIILKANIAKITAITIHCDAPGNAFCVRCTTGFLEINDCMIKSNCAGAFIVGKDDNEKDDNKKTGAKLWVQRSEVKIDSKNITIISPDSRAIFTDCSFIADKEALAKSNIENAVINIGEKSTGILNNCTYSTVSIIFHQNSKGMVCNSRIENVKVGVTVLANAEALILQSTFENCLVNGICLSPDSKAVIQNCVISKINSNSEKEKAVGIIVQGAKDFGIVGTHVIGNYVGCRIYEGAKGSIVDSLFHENITGIQMESNCSASIRRSAFTYNRNSGITAFHTDDKSQQTSNLNIYSSTFSYNTTSIALIKSIHCLIRGSFFFFSVEKEIVVNDNSVLDLNDSSFGEQAAMAANVDQQSILRNSSTKIAILASAVATIRNVTFSKKIICGLKCTGKANVNLIKTDVKCNNISIDAEHDSVITVSGQSHVESGIKAKGKAEVNVKELSTVTSSGQTDIQVAEDAKLNVENSTITKGKFGIIITGNVVCNIKNSKIVELAAQTKKVQGSETIHSAGIFIQGSETTRPSLTVEATEFSSAGQIAICAENLINGAQFNVINSVFKHEVKKMVKKITKTGIFANIVQNALVRGCVFDNIIEDCILMKGGSYFMIENSIFKSDCKSGITAERSNVSVTQCKFVDRLSFGIYLRDGSQSEVKSSTFEQIRTKPIDIDNNGMPCSCIFDNNQNTIL